MGLSRSCCSRRRLLGRGLEFHVCTINESAHTINVRKPIVCTSYMIWFGWVYGISTTVGHLMPNPFCHHDHDHVSCVGTDIPDSLLATSAMGPSRSSWNGTSALQLEESTSKGTSVSCVYYQ